MFLSASPALETLFTGHDDISVALGDQQMATCIQQYLSYDSVRSHYSCVVYRLFLLWRHYSLDMMTSSVTFNKSSCKEIQSGRAVVSCASDLTLAEPLQQATE